MKDVIRQIKYRELGCDQCVYWTGPRDKDHNKFHYSFSSYCWKKHNVFDTTAKMDINPQGLILMRAGEFVSNYITSVFTHNLLDCSDFMVYRDSSIESK